MNKIFLIGNLTADPEVRMVNENKCVNFNLAINTHRKDPEGNPKTNFYRVTVWRGLGEIVEKYCKKGNKVAVVGRVCLNTYNDKNGLERSSLEVDAEEIELLTPKSQNNEATPANNAYPQQNRPVAPVMQSTMRPNVPQMAQPMAQPTPIPNYVTQQQNPQYQMNPQYQTNYAPVQNAQPVMQNYGGQNNAQTVSDELPF